MSKNKKHNNKNIKSNESKNENIKEVKKEEINTNQNETNENNNPLNQSKNNVSKTLYLVIFILLMMYMLNSNKDKNNDTENVEVTTQSEETNEEINTVTTTNKNLNDLKKVYVKRVVDGDTFIYEEDGEEVRVRLIGINTPESVTPEENLKKGQENTIEGKYASNYTTNLIENKNVFLEYDKEQYDKYDRELAYVYLEDGRMVQDILLIEGYADLMTIKPNVKYENRFKLEVK